MTNANRARQAGVVCALAGLGAVLACSSSTTNSENGVGGSAGASIDAGIDANREDHEDVASDTSDAGVDSSSPDAHDAADATDATDGGVCSSDVDLCKTSSGALLPGDEINVFLDTAQPKINQPFNLFIVSQLPIGQTTLDIGGSYCTGGALSKSCVSPAAGCAGWNVARHVIQWPTAGPFTIYVRTNDADAPCDVPVAAKIDVIFGT